MRRPLPPERDLLKRAAVARAMTEVEDGIVVPLDSGSTAAVAVEALAVRTTNCLCDTTSAATPGRQRNNV
jgi:ribose 5-phosphate isomerase